MEGSATNMDEDWQLVQRVVQKNDAVAFDILYERYSREIFRRLFRLLGNEEQSKDALQQVFLEAFQSLPQYRGEGLFKSWLHRIAERVVFAQYKKKWQSRTLLERLWSQPRRSTAKIEANPETEAFRLEMRNVIQECLQQLSPVKRMALALCYMEGQTYEEAAEVLGISVGTVASRMHHARNEMQSMLQHHLRKLNLDIEEIIRELETQP